MAGRLHGDVVVADEDDVINHHQSDSQPHPPRVNLNEGLAVVLERVLPQLAVKHEPHDDNDGQNDDRRDFMKPAGPACASSFVRHRPLAPVKSPLRTLLSHWGAVKSASNGPRRRYLLSTAIVTA